MTVEFPPIDVSAEPIEGCTRVRAEQNRDRCLDPRCQRCYPEQPKENRS